MAVKPRGSRYGWLSGVRDARCCQPHHEARAHARPDAAAFRVRAGVGPRFSLWHRTTVAAFVALLQVSATCFFFNATSFI